MTAGIYRIFNGSGDLLYVGKSINMFSRIMAHSREQKWWDEVTDIKFQYCDIDELDDIERKAINDENPQYNSLRYTNYYGSNKSRQKQSVYKTPWIEPERIRLSDDQTAAIKRFNKSIEHKWRSNINVLLDSCYINDYARSVIDEFMKTGRRLWNSSRWGEICDHVNRKDQQVDYGYLWLCAFTFQINIGMAVLDHEWRYETLSSVSNDVWGNITDLNSMKDDVSHDVALRVALGEGGSHDDNRSVGYREAACNR